MILGPVEHTVLRDPCTGQYVSASEAAQRPDFVTLVREPVLEAAVIKEPSGRWVLKEDRQITVMSKAEKMSKSKGNVVNPDSVVAQFGADSLRLHLMFMGPLEAVKAWNMATIDGVHRFLSRVWRLYCRSFTSEKLREMG
eukprot:SAG31_NODE_11994_length_979_cov_0.934091_1_plen_139_part_01